MSDLPAISALFAQQHDASRHDQSVPLALRLDRIDRAIDMLVSHGDRLCAAMNADFGHRAVPQSLALDLTLSLDALKFARRHLARWLKPERRRCSFPLGWLGARLEVRRRPLGVVCIIGAWNFPVGTLTGPLAGVLAGGNRAILKPSELTPLTAAALEQAVAASFDPSEVAVVTGDKAAGEHLTSLPFDRIVFTGGAPTARHIMRAAATHLVPLTLELGGKSPVIIGRGADLAQAARQIMGGKLVNAGQVCVGPDYVLAPRAQADALARLLTEAAARMYPTLLANPDYAGMPSAAHRARVRELVDDAVRRGARQVPINPADEDFDGPDCRKIMPCLLLDVDGAMDIMRHEIFGPVLPIVPYDDIDAAIAHVNAGSRPLSLYYFGHDRREQEQVLGRTVSGGVTLNDVIMHVAHEDAPFGGVGASGYGQYRGRDGFEEFTTAQTVLRQSPLALVQTLLHPPYSPATVRLLRARLKR